MSGAISMTQAAKLIGVDRGHLKRLTESGEIPYWFRSDSGRYMYSLETIEEHKRLAARRSERSAS